MNRFDNTTLRRLRWLIAGGLLLAIGFLVGFAFGHLQPGSRLARYNLVVDARQLLEDNYLGDLPSNGVLQRGMIRGLLEAVGDPYTKYLTPTDHELESQSLGGQYGGIGALLSQDEASYILIPYEGGPADKAGIQEGDALLQVDDLIVSLAQPQSEITAAIRGEPGTAVHLRVARRGNAPQTIDVTVVRQSIPLPSVTTYLHPSHPQVGVLTLSNFGDGTFAEVRRGIDELEGRGAEHLVIDLRGNPGGLIDSAIEVADLFLSDGVIMIEQFKEGEPRIYRATASADDIALPLAVVVDGGTASSAEVLAAALQTPGRAVLVGQNTFGKGSVQAIFALDDGSSLHITTARWLGPDGNQLDTTGIAPDILVEPATDASDPLLMVAVERLLSAQDRTP